MLADEPALEEDLAAALHARAATLPDTPWAGSRAVPRRPIALRWRLPIATPYAGSLLSTILQWREKTTRETGARTPATPRPEQQPSDHSTTTPGPRTQTAHDAGSLLPVVRWREKIAPETSIQTPATPRPGQQPRDHSTTTPGPIDAGPRTRAAGAGVPPPLCGMRARPPRWGAVVVAVVAVALAGVVVVVSRGAAGPPAASTSDSQDHLAPGHFYYSRAVTAEGSGVRVRSEVWQPRRWTDEWVRRSQVGDGKPVTARGRCLSLAAPAGTEACSAEPGWANPTPEFLASAPRAPVSIEQQLAAAVTHPGEPVSHPSDAFAELTLLRGAARAGGLPSELSQALQRTAALLAPGVAAENLDGLPGTSYRLTGPNGATVTVLFDAHGAYVGSPTESFTRGAAAEAGAPPVRWFTQSSIPGP